MTIPSWIFCRPHEFLMSSFGVDQKRWFATRLLIVVGRTGIDIHQVLLILWWLVSQNAEKSTTNHGTPLCWFKRFPYRLMHWNWFSQAYFHERWRQKTPEGVLHILNLSKKPRRILRSTRLQNTVKKLAKPTGCKSGNVDHIFNMLFQILPTTGGQWFFLEFALILLTSDYSRGRAHYHVSKSQRKTKRHRCVLNSGYPNSWIWMVFIGENPNPRWMI